MLAFVLGVKLKLNIKNQACEGLAKLQNEHKHLPLNYYKDFYM